MTPEHEIGIVEMGANHLKEIEFLCSICEPDFGYITNFGKAHLEGFGSLEGVILGKSELYTFLKKNNKIAFVNLEDKIQIDKTKNIETVFINNKHLSLVDVNPFVKILYNKIDIQSNLVGKYNFANIAAAITIGAYFKVYKTHIKEAIESYIPKNNRSQIIETKTNKIVLDAYNANPSSMQVALENFAAIPSEQKTIILGDMFELGTESLVEHQAIIDLADSFNFENQYFVGENFNQTKTDKNQFKTYRDLYNYIKKNPLENQSILIKGSRGMSLERILEIII